MMLFAHDGQVLAPAKTPGVMRQIIFNDYVDATLGGLFVIVVIVTVLYGVRDMYRALGNPRNTAVEIGEAALAGGGND